MADNKVAKSSRPKHVEYMDIGSDGILKEVAVVKRWDDGSIAYIQTEVLDNIDRGRLKAIITGLHADRYELWELLSMTKLNNGLNGLDYFHQHTKVKRVKGSAAASPGQSLMDARAQGGAMVGSEFTDPGQFAPENSKGSQSI
jgi:hypothetical protein